MESRSSSILSTMFSWKVGGDELDGVETKHADVLPIVRMTMRRVMSGAGLHEHSNDDSYGWVQQMAQRPTAIRPL